MSSHVFPRAILAGALAVSIAGSAAAATTISGAGATFPYPIYAKWAEAYAKVSGIQLNYQAIGSGGGIKQIKARTVTFGASDKPLKAEDLKAANLVQWPMVMGGIVPVVNISGIKSGEITFDGPTLAKIFLGEIKTWDDPALKALNPGVALPSAAIAVVHRSDGSGTTFNFTDYLSKVSPSWKSKVGEDASVKWPVGIGAKGNEGVASNVSQTQNSIGYVEFAYAMQNKLTYADLINADGKKVEPVADAFAAAAANADWASAPGFYLILTNQHGEKSWPITASTFILMPTEPKDPEAAAAALKFFGWAYANGDEAAKALDYIPMPHSVVELVKKEWAAQIKGSDGKPLQF
jgi:phosphate transport system substrate-binding protein